MNPGDELAGRYRLEELAGRGPMSEVWRAHDDTLDRTVALKLLAPTADLERFRREARAVASLGHEHVMRVYDYGEDAAGPYMALEWLPGGTLEERLHGGEPMPAAVAGPIAAGIASGLAHLHERGFVHRDLKPANVLFDEEDRVKLADFGLARSAVGAGTLTEAGTVMGTAAYISPEQAGGEPATAASDVYSFGVLLFRMLTGVLPFVADDALALVDMHRNRPAPPVTAVNPTADPVLAGLADASLAKDPAARPPDGAALLAALGGAPIAAAAVISPDTMATQVIPAAAGVPPPRAAGSAWARRNVAAVALALLLLALVGGALAWAIARPPAAAPSGIVHTGTKKNRKGTTTTNPFSSTTNPSTSTRSQSTTTRNTTTTRRTTTPTTVPATTTAATSTQQTTTQVTTTTTTTPSTTTTPTTTTPATTAGLTTTTS